MTRLASFPRGLIVGATLVYFLDPRRGKLRRRRIADVMTQVLRSERKLFGKAARDASHRARGVVERMRRQSDHPEAVDDVVLAARVRSALGRVVSHPSTVEVVAYANVVTLRGSLLAIEAPGALRCARAVRGVRQVRDELERRARGDLRTAIEPPRPRSAHWKPIAQVVAMTGGTAIALYGAIFRRGWSGYAVAAAGGALALRGAFDMPLGHLARHALGREEIAVRKLVTVNAPIERVFGLWRDLENFPRFMDHVKAVERDRDQPMHVNWTVDGPIGIAVHFETETTRIEHLKEIAWRTVPGQTIEHTGRVRFIAADVGTRILIEMSFRAPGGVIGHAIAQFLGWDPKRRIDDDMIRMKELLEEGHTRAHGEHVDVADLVH